MKKVSFLCLIAFGLFFSSCHSSSDTWGDWSVVAQFGGVPRVGAVCFTAENGAVFAGLGLDQKDNPLKDLWVNTNGAWSQLDSMPKNAPGRMSGVAFVLNGKAYVGTGYQSAYNNLEEKAFDDFWVFDLATKKWEATPLAGLQKFPGAPRYGAIAFTLNGKAYVGTGMDKDKNRLGDFYSFDGNSWTVVSSPVFKRSGATVFVINNNAYICLGQDNSYLTDMWKFDGNKFTELPKLADVLDDGFDDDYAMIPRTYAVSFLAVRDGVQRAYIAGGSNGSLTKTCWEFDPATERWDEVTQLPSRCAGRVQAIGYTIGDKGYMSTGGPQFGSAVYDDTWQFIPDIEEDDRNDYQ